MANAEYCDLLDDVNAAWVRSKPHRGFKLKGKRWQNKGRKLPVPTARMEKLRDRMIAKAAKPGDLIFPSTSAVWRDTSSANCKPLLSVRG